MPFTRRSLTKQEQGSKSEDADTAIAQPERQMPVIYNNLWDALQAVSAAQSLASHGTLDTTSSARLPPSNVVVIIDDARIVARQDWQELQFMLLRYISSPAEDVVKTVDIYFHYHRNQLSTTTNAGYINVATTDKVQRIFENSKKCTKNDLSLAERLGEILGMYYGKLNHDHEPKSASSKTQPMSTYVILVTTDISSDEMRTFSDLMAELDSEHQLDVSNVAVKYVCMRQGQHQQSSATSQIPRQRQLSSEQPSQCTHPGPMGRDTSHSGPPQTSFARFVMTTLLPGMGSG